VTGEVEALDKNSAAKLVRKRGHVVVSMRPIRGSSPFSFGKKVSSSDVVIFTRQFATMFNAGLPIVDILNILRVQAKPAMQTVITQILADVEGGESLSTAIKKHPKVFPPTFIALIKSGETGGVLGKVLLRLADNLEKQREFKGKVKGALIYPAIIVVGMIVVSMIMIVFVIPKLLSLYEQFDAELPLTTQMMMTVSKIVTKGWFIWVPAVVIGVWGFVIFRRTKTGERKIAEFVFEIPFMGELQKQIILTEITRTLALMIGAGVPILDSLSITAGVVDNVLVSEALEDVGKQVEKGFPISFAFGKHSDIFPQILTQMISVGEETGKMEEVLNKVAHVFEVDSEQKVKGLTSAIEPVVMIILGIGVALLVISVILPIYNLTTVL